MKPPFKALIIACLILLYSCSQIQDLEDIETVAFEAAYAVPLAEMKVSLDRLLENFQDSATLVVDPNGLFHFRYSGDVLSETGSDLFAEIETAFEDISNLTPRGIPVIFPELTVPFQIPGDVEIDNLVMSGGELTYEFQSMIPDPVKVTFRLPNFYLDGTPLTFEHNLPAFSGTGAPPSVSIVDMPFDMAGVEIIPENEEITIEYTAISETTQQPVLLSNFFFKVTNVDLTYAQGFLGTNVFDGPLDIIPIDFFEDWIAGDVFFDNPRVTYLLENSFGIPTRSVVNIFDVITVEGNVLPLESELIDNGLDFPYPRLDEVGETKTAAFVFTKDNSNIEDILSSRPVEVRYDVDALTHPDGNKNIRGFLTDSSFYKVGVDVDLPFIGRASNFVARDTFELSVKDLSEFDSMELKILSINEIPIGIDVQIYMLTENGVILDSLLDERERFVEAAPVNSAGDVTNQITRSTFVDIGGERLDALANAEKLVIIAAFSTVNNGDISVNIYNDQEFDLKLGAILKVKVE